jgi:hypothetical protein
MSMVLCEWHLHFGFQCGNEGSSMRQNVGSTKLVAHFILSPSCPKFHVQRFYVMDLFQEKLFLLIWIIKQQNGLLTMLSIIILLKRLFYNTRFILFSNGCKYVFMPLTKAKEVKTPMSLSFVFVQVKFLRNSEHSN